MAEKTPPNHIHPCMPCAPRPSNASALEMSPPLASKVATEDTPRQAHAEPQRIALGLPDRRHGMAMESMVFTPNPNVHWTILEGEAVLLNLDNGVYYTLNPMGTVIWGFFIEDQSFKEILVSICERFAVTHEQAREDLEALVTRLHQEGLIITREE